MISRERAPGKSQGSWDFPKGHFPTRRKPSKSLLLKERSLLHVVTGQFVVIKGKAQGQNGLGKTLSGYSSKPRMPRETLGGSKESVAFLGERRAPRIMRER